MVARTAPRAFTPGSPARIAVAHDGTLAAIVEPGRATVVELPAGTAVSEVGLDAAAEAIDVAWVGTRLLVLARYHAHSAVHLLDPAGPRSLAEIRLESPMRMLAAVQQHALLVGPAGAAVLAVADALLVPYQFQARTAPAIAGCAGTLFVVSLPGTIEEWDPISRMPKRRLRLPRPMPVGALGGSDRVVWMTTQHEPARIDVLPLINRGQPKHHDLPDAITAVAGHPRSDLVACVAGGRLYAVDLDGRTRLRTIAADGLDRIEAAALVVGRTTGFLAAQAGRPLAFHTLETREHEPAPRAPARSPDDEPPRRSTLTDDDDPPPSPLRARMMGLEPPPAEPAPADAPPPSSLSERLRGARASSDPPREPEPPPPVSDEPPRPRAAWSASGPSLADRLSAIRPRPADAPVRSSWRDDVVLWAKAITAGTFDRAAPIAPPIEALAATFELPELQPALVLLYGAHLAGLEGVAPVDVSRVLARSWDEALGRGKLARLGIAGYARSRVVLAQPIQRVLDELPPAAGTLVGEGAPAVLGPCGVIAAPAEPLAEVAARLGVGAILAARDGAALADVVLEARARHATALVRQPTLPIPDGPLIVAVPMQSILDDLGLPLLR